MDFFKKLKKTEGGYIFLSHSHLDIDKVRQIRNLLEEDGFEPLCFYLKCLNDDSEIEDLIKREIDAREWFIFMNSANSRQSKWVTLEREYITQTDKKKILTMDLHDDESIKATIEKIRHNLRVYISYSAKDRLLGRQIKKSFEEKDYQVFFAPDSIPAGSMFEQVITNAIVEASHDGCVIALLTEHSIRSPLVEQELALAMKQRGNIIPIIIGDVSADTDSPIWQELSNYNAVFLPESPSDEMIDQCIDKIGRIIANR